MTNDTDDIQELAEAAQVEAELRRRIEVQAGMISVALAYLKGGQPHLAGQVLTGALPPHEP